MKLYLNLKEEEVHSSIPYALVCMTRYGSHWDTFHRRRRWKEEFTEDERAACTRLFRHSHVWLLGGGVPDTVKMSLKTFALWQKLGDFCSSI